MKVSRGFDLEKFGEIHLLPPFRIDVPADLPKDVQDDWMNKKFPEKLIPVRRYSPYPLRLRVEKFANYFRREFAYDFIQYSAKNDGGYSAYLFCDKTFAGHLAIGACCFRWSEEVEIKSCWILQWVWLHPYFRDRGYLTDAWEYFNKKLGPFAVESPLSNAMGSFLEKRGYDPEKVLEQLKRD